MKATMLSFVAIALFTLIITPASAACPTAGVTTLADFQAGACPPKVANPTPAPAVTTPAPIQAATPAPAPAVAPAQVATEVADTAQQHQPAMAPTIATAAPPAASPWQSYPTQTGQACYRSRYATDCYTETYACSYPTPDHSHCAWTRPGLTFGGIVSESLATVTDGIAYGGRHGWQNGSGYNNWNRNPVYHNNGPIGGGCHRSWITHKCQ